MTLAARLQAALARHDLNGVAAAKAQVADLRARIAARIAARAA